MDLVSFLEILGESGLQRSQFLICFCSSVGSSIGLKILVSVVRSHPEAPAEGRHYPCVAQRLAEGSLICASGQTTVLTQGFLMIGLGLPFHLKALFSMI